MSFRFSSNVQKISPPPILLAKEWARSYVPTPSRPLLDLSHGVPGSPPSPILLSALTSIVSNPAKGVHGYGLIPGEISLRKALADEMRRIYKHDEVEADVNAEDVVITAGCNLAFVASILTLADAGDEVILPVPWYFNHQMTLQMFGINTVPLHTHETEGFLPSASLAEPLITNRTKAIVLVTPNNPTGAIYPPALLRDFASLCSKHRIALILDETYRDFLIAPNDRHHDLFVKSPDWEWRQHIIHLFSFSKSYAIPGHRVGAVAAGPEVINYVITVLDNIQICAPKPIQLALAKTLPSLCPSIQATSAALASRRKLFIDSLPPTWKVWTTGAYYAFVEHPFAGQPSKKVCERLAKELGVVVLPSAFFQEDDPKVVERDRLMRVSIANVGDAEVIDMCGRLKDCDDWTWD